jgi:hypothetical protein
MEQRLILAGSSEAFTTVFRRTLEDCGFKVELDRGEGAAGCEAREVFVYEIKGKEDFSGLPENKEPKPYLVFAAAGMDRTTVEALKQGGLVGVITGESSHEEIALMVNAAFFYTRMIKRNPRAQVSMPVEIRADSRSIKTTASSLSRDGIFAVTLNPLPENTVCELFFEDPLSGKRLSTSARVLYNISINKDLSIISSPGDPFKRVVTHPGMALLFLDLPEKEREHLESYIKTVG